jgi:asparagine synthase (glutamine-hydrolysing)
MMKKRGELERKGHVFKTHTDSEVIIHGYEEYGHNVLIISRIKKLKAMQSRT